LLGTGETFVNTHPDQEAGVNAGAGPIKAYRRYWFPELAALILLAAGTIILFTATNLDIASLQPFYRQSFADPWPRGNEPLWSLLYRSAPWVTGALAVIGTVLVVIGVLRNRSKQARTYGLFILLCVAIGPGLIINVALKDHWGRPRPRQIVEFGGKFAYVQPLVPASVRGKSFPCGHCSVGYLYALGWWVWRRRHPRWATVSLVAGLTLGTFLGLGRMATGAHFLSDAVWAALISFSVAHVLYYYVLRIPAREDSRATLYPVLEQSPRLKAAAVAGMILLGAGIMGGGMLANPSDRDLTALIRLDDFPARPVIIKIVADTLDIDLRLVGGSANEIECTGAVHGFGLPTNKITAVWQFEERPRPTVFFNVSQKGLFTDIDGIAHVSIPVQRLERIIVRVKRGDVSVVDATGGGVAPDQLPQLDLATADGRVLRR
jgi:lipid A 4'-phosphatase